MKKAIFTILILLYFSVIAAALIPSSEQRIASMELNRSIDSMTGDDYLVALVFAHINDTGTAQPTNEANRLQVKGEEDFPRYYHMFNRFSDELGGYIDEMVADISDREGIDRVVYNMFSNRTENPESFGYWVMIDEARAASSESYARLAEKARQRAHLEEMELQRQKELEEKKAQAKAAEARQTELDAYFASAYENYSKNVTLLLNDSKLDDALNLTEAAINDLKSPQRNAMMIARGDIYLRIDEPEKAIDCYNISLTEFEYSNDSMQYQEGVREAFISKWSSILEMKRGIAMQKIQDVMTAHIQDLHDAPNVKKLLADHDHGRKYSITIENHTRWEQGYVVSINLSSITDPKQPSSYFGEVIRPCIPTYIDMFGALFHNPLISKVHIQENESYYDKFGHVIEAPLMWITLDSETAKQVGDWSAFKQYIGTDLSKLGKVADYGEA